MGCVTSPVHCPSRNCQWDVLPLPCFCCTVRPGTVSGMCYLSRALSVRELSVGCVTLSLVSAALSVRELSVGPVTSPKFLPHCPSGNCQWDVLPPSEFLPHGLPLHPVSFRGVFASYSTRGTLRHHRSHHSLAECTYMTVEP